MAGRKTLRSIRMAREATNGTRVTPRYLWRGVGDWVVDEREVTKVEELVGISGGTDRTYISKLKASMEIAETEATYKQLPALFYGLGLIARAGFGAFGTRTPSIYSNTGSIWRYGLNIPSTVFSTTPSYTIESGDNAEAQVAVYGVTEEVTLTFEAGESAKVSANFLSQYGTRTNEEGSFSAAGTLENVTVILSSKTKAVDILDISFAALNSNTTALLRKVWASSGSAVWAVGPSGTIRFFNGSAWVGQTSGSSSSLQSVWGTSASSVWTVGSGGAILFYNGSTWSAQTSGISTQLNGIWGSSATSVWAVGENGTILFYNGSTWAAQPVILDGESVRGVAGTIANAIVWAVGTNGNIWIYNGTKWTPINGFSQNSSIGNVLNAEVTFKALWSPKYWVDGGVLFPGTMVLTGHEITGNITFEHQNGGSIAAAGTSGQIEKWRNQQAQVLNMLWTDTDSFGSEVAFGFRIPIKWDTFQGYDDMDGNNIVSGEFTTKYNETIGNRGFLVFHTGHDYSNIVGTV